MTEDRNGNVVLNAARACRPYLGQLVEADIVDAVDESIRTALERSAFEDVDEAIEQTFAAHPALQDWVATYYEYGVPPEFVAYAERNLRPPGEAAPLPPPAAFVCPIDGNYVRFTRLAFEPPGNCPDHGVPLVPAGSN